MMLALEPQQYKPGLGEFKSGSATTRARTVRATVCRRTLMSAGTVAVFDFQGRPQDGESCGRGPSISNTFFEITLCYLMPDGAVVCSQF